MPEFRMLLGGEAHAHDGLGPELTTRHWTGPTRENCACYESVAIPCARAQSAAWVRSLTLI